MRRRELGASERCRTKRPVSSDVTRQIFTTIGTIYKHYWDPKKEFELSRPTSDQETTTHALPFYAIEQPQIQRLHLSRPEHNAVKHSTHLRVTLRQVAANKIAGHNPPLLPRNMASISARRHEARLQRRSPHQPPALRLGMDSWSHSRVVHH